MALTDRQLVARSRQGDREAFGDLVDQDKNMCYHLALRW
jgi:hypothetical protein